MPWLKLRRRGELVSRSPAEESGVPRQPQAVGPMVDAVADGGSRWPQVDQPIRCSAEDFLGRGSFVDRVCHLLDELRAIEESSVVALVGPWGSGKSSTINLIGERMSGSWQVCTVSTWAPPDVSALLTEFFAAISSALPGGERTRQLKERLSEYAQLAVPALGAIPMFGQAVQGVDHAGVLAAVAEYDRLGR
jgi:predicted KAP-like P-loop ATPase